MIREILGWIVHIVMIFIIMTAVIFGVVCCIGVWVQTIIPFFLGLFGLG